MGSGTNPPKADHCQTPCGGKKAGHLNSYDFEAEYCTVEAMEIFKEFTIEAAHFLPNVPEGHKCRRLHGHSYRVVIHVDDHVDRSLGWVHDFSSIGKIFEPIKLKLDHHCLNEVDGLANPTAENVAVWIWDRLKPKLPLLCKVVVWETNTSGCAYSG